MATETTNLKLNKPDKTDFYNIDLMNENMDKIDKAIRENADTIGIETVTADTTIVSLMQKVEVGKSKKFQYTNDNDTNLPSDYPSIMLNAKAIFMPIITVNRITAGLMYLEIISPNQSTGVPKTITGYYNGTFYWNEELSITNVANNLTTNQEGYVLDARQGKALSSRIDTLNNNLNLFGLINRGDVPHIIDIDNIGLYSITNASEMPSGNPYTILSLGKKGREWNFPLIAFDAYGNGTYRGRIGTSDGKNYIFTNWTTIC